MYKRLLFIILLSAFAFSAWAQKPDTVAVGNKKDSLNRVVDSVKSKPFVPKVTKEKEYHPDSTHSPHKAVIRALELPGWGQVYNHQYWKLPLVYGLIGFLAGNIVVQNGNYQEFLKLSQYREKGIIPTPGQPYYQDYVNYASVPTASIYAANDIYRRNRDLSILLLGAAWGLQTVDAYIAAKFIHSYTMDNDLSMKIQPSLIGQPAYASTNNIAVNSIGFFPSLKITFTFK
jgi:hypothetical protein